MAMSHTDIVYLLSLQDRISWEKIGPWLDMGVQELEGHGQTEILASFVRALNPETEVRDEQVAALAESCYMQDLFNLAGREYQCVDVAGERPFTHMDLNFDPLPPGWEGRFDVVTNSGTSEHVHNQYHLFANMHQAAKPGGYLYHVLPCAGFSSHGFFNYNPKFFAMLARANRYELVDMFLQVDVSQERLDKQVLPLLSQNKPFLVNAGQGPEDIPQLFRSTNTGIRVLLRKKGDAPFRPALDLLGQDDSHLVDNSQGRLSRSEALLPVKIGMLRRWAKGKLFRRR